jgi:hypothetical protein
MTMAYSTNKGYSLNYLIIQDSEGRFYLLNARQRTGVVIEDLAALPPVDPEWIRYTEGPNFSMDSVILGLAILPWLVFGLLFARYRKKVGAG